MPVPVVAFFWYRITGVCTYNTRYILVPQIILVGTFLKRKKNLTSLVFPFGPTPSFFGRRVGSEFAFRPCMVYAQRCIRTYACKYINRLNCYQMHH